MSIAPTMMRRHGSIEPSGHSIVLPIFHQAVSGARSIFPSRVFGVDEVQRVLKSGHQGRKIGAFVSKGPRKGWPIFMLTLEERATCPRSCREFQSCYGNAMQAAERLEHGEHLLEALEAELEALQAAHPGGFLVRLHILGDFYSVGYVEFWSRMLAELPALHLWGFTARDPASEIGRAVSLLAEEFGWSRAAIRFSGAPHEVRASRVLGPGESDDDAILCPAQTGATACCGSCSLCWQSERSIAFRRH
jgi:hypothetical protein